MTVSIACDRCRGTAFVRGVRCRTCAGNGIAATWGDRVLVWPLPVDRVAVRGRRIDASVRAAVALAVGAVGVALIGSAAFGFRVPRWNSAAIGLGVLCVLATVTTAARARARAAVRPPACATLPEAPLVPPPSWNAISRTRVDVAASFAPDARGAIAHAAVIAEKLQHASVTPLHCLGGILGRTEGSAIFARLGVDFDALTTRMRNALARIPTFAQSVGIAPETADILFAAYVDAAAGRRPVVRAIDLLLACSARDATVRAILDDLGIPHQHIVNVAAWVRVRDALRQRYRAYHAIGRLRPKHGMNRAMTAIATPILDQFGEDLTARASAGYLGPIVGRAREFAELFRLVASGRRGIVFVGEPGVGKGAMLEGIAERMAADDVPEQLRDKRLVRLAIPRLVSGVPPAVAQGRLLAALVEVARSGNIVLAVDPLEQLVESDGTGIDLSDVLASALERGAGFLVAVTTPEAYRRTIERSALGGLLERVPIAEPHGDDAIQIIEARSVLVEGRARVAFSYGAVAACVELSDRYLHDRSLPEKGVALMEEVAAMVRTSRGEGALVMREDVAKVIEEKTGVPATTVTADEAQKLLHLESTMRERVIGQDEAVRMIAAALRRARVELREGNRPIATFLFLGPTGVGKTELAKTVAATYFGDAAAMVRLDMSEYQDASSVARLIGAAPGYAGAESGGQLTEAVRHQPFALILLDEIEKAHPDILNLFLQVFDDGRLTDSMGRTVDFTNAIIIATSNAAATYIQDATRAGTPIAEIQRVLLERELRGTFRPEFLNRFDGVIVFAPLTEESVRAIARILLAVVARQLEAKGIHLRVTDAAVAELAAAGFDPQFGARPLRRAIQERVQDALATFLLTSKLGRRDTVVLDAGGTLTIEKAPEI